MNQKEIEVRLKAIPGVTGILSGSGPFIGNVTKRLPSILQPDETIETALWGMWDGKHALAVATPRRVVLVTAQIFGSKVEDLDYSKVTSVQYKTGLTMGEVTFLASGNSITVDKVQKANVQPFAEWVRDRIAMGGKPPTPAAPTAAADDPADQLRKLAALRDDGIISAEDFEAKKRQLLGL